MCQASQDLGVHTSQLRDWVKKFADDPQYAFPGHGQMRARRLEIARLKREVTKLKAERDILKKAAAYFAKSATAPPAKCERDPVKRAPLASNRKSSDAPLFVLQSYSCCRDNRASVRISVINAQTATMLENGPWLWCDRNVACWKSCISTMPLPCFFSFAMTDCLTCFGLRILKSKESRSAEKIAILRFPRYSISSRGR